MKTSEYIFSSVALLALTLVSCENFFDEKQLDNVDYRPTDVRTSMTYTMTADDVASVGKQCTYKGNDTVPSVYEQKALSLCTETDSAAYIEWKKIASLKAFTEDASPDIYLPMFMATKFPYLDAGTICNVTYPLYEGKSTRQEPFNYASAYTLTEDDYRAIWGGRGASYMTKSSEEKIPDFLKKTFTMVSEGKIMVLDYQYQEQEPDTIYPALSYICTVGELLEAREKEEHQLSGLVGSVESTTYGRFYLVDGSDSIYVYGVTDEAGNRVWKDKGIKKGDQITIKGNYTEFDGEPQFANAVYISHTSAPSPAPRRAQTYKIENGVKKAVYQFKNGEWGLYENEQLYVFEIIPQSVYDALGNTNINNADKTIGDYLRRNYPYAQEKQIYMMVYMGASGLTADEWTFDGTDFVMNTGFVYDVMSFVHNPGAWVANISTYYTTPFVGDGPADFTMHTVALDGLNYIWRYQASYGMTASAYVSGTNHPVEGWLVSPKIRLKKSEKPELTFYHAVRFGNPIDNLEWLKVRVTDNYTGDVITTKWEHLEFPDSIPDGSNWVFRNAGRFDLSKYNGETIVIGFEYNTTIGEVPSAPTWEIQDLLVAEEDEVTAFIKAGNEKRNIVD
ncbi:MAG: choice-of-anchor J domain-containing protein [Paludibacteraceae bacterium]|nr:choice-of-anchor J domain-containing protein [Paludibacteraceae bacterium]